MKYFSRLFVTALVIVCGQLLANETTLKANEAWTPNGTIAIKAAGKWGNEASGISCRITTNKKEYHIGEPIFILVEIKNNTSDAISIGVEPMVKVRDAGFHRQPARLQTVFSQHYKGRLGFFSTVEQSFPPGKAWDRAQTVNINPGKIYSKVITRAPTISYSAHPSTAQPGAMSLRTTYMQFGAKGAEGINAKSNIIQFVMLPRDEKLIDKNIKAANRIASEAFNRKDYKAAEQALSYLMFLRPSFAEAYVMAGMVELKLGKKEAAGFSLKTALEIFQDKVKKSPKDCNSLFQQVFVLMLLNRPEDAKKILELGQKQFPDNSLFRVSPTEMEKMAQYFLDPK